MIKKQTFIDELDTNGTVRLVTEVDTSLAIEEAKEIERAGGRIGHGDTEWIALGTFPQEMWAYDPWLQEARRAASAGDMGEYNRLLRKFFDVHKEFRSEPTKKYWNGSR